MHATSKGVIVALWIATAAAAFGIGRITSPPQEPPAPNDLAASIRSALGEGGVIERQGRISRLLERLDPDGLPEVAALYERMIPLLDSSELGAFFAAWARFDPAGALDHARSWPRREMKEQREVGVRAAIQVWAQLDPSAARLAAEKIAAVNPRLRDALWHGLVTGWAHSPQGQEGLGAFIADLPPLRHRDEAVENAVRELLRDGGADAALGWADPILRDEDYNPIFKRSVFGSAIDSTAQWDPERAAAWVMEHSEADYAEEGPSVVAKHWSRQDGAAAMAWLGEQPAGALRDQAVREAFGEWSRTDPRRAKAWLNSEKLTALHDPALEIKAERQAAFEPERALGWCERIQESSRQQSCLESTARSWYGRNAVEAEAWLQQSSLDEEARSRVRNAPGLWEEQRPDPQGQQRPGPRRPRAGPR
jgi:hypothetical protein